MADPFQKMDLSENPVPVKKRKMMHVPDGFDTLIPKSDRTPARKFSSAFPESKRLILSSKDTLLGMPSRAKHPVPQFLPNDHPKRMPVQQPSLLTPEPPHAGPSRHAAATLAGNNMSGRFLKPPSVAATPASACKFTIESRLPRSRLSSEAKPVAKASIHDFLPRFPARETTMRTMRVLPPPPPPPPRKKGPALPEGVHLKTISTTSIAIAMDPRTESGLEEIMALGLAQTATEYVPPAERELNRGLKQSPEKASKTKAAKFIRGGLADRAQHLFSKRNTGLVLWSKDMQLQAQRPKDHKAVAPDLALRVFEVSHITSIASLLRTQNVPRLAIVKCAHIVKGRTTGDVTVLLDFGNADPAAWKPHALDEVKEGKDLHIWCPYSSSDPHSKDLIQFGALPRDGTILFCTRFRLV